MTQANNPTTRKLGDEHLHRMGLGLSGAHRTGKTTVAKILAEENECPFLTSSASAIAKELGITVGPGLAPADRRRFQEEILTRFKAQYEAEAGYGVFLTDRTPIDLAAYALADWTPEADDEHEQWLLDYVDRCMVTTSRYFFMVGIIQPGIPYAVADGKPAPNEVYQEVLNTTMIGLVRDPKVKAFSTIIKREVTDTQARCSLLTDEYTRRVSAYRNNLETALGTQ